MILNPNQAKEIGEAMIDASQKCLEDGIEQYVIYLDEIGKAVCLPADSEIHSCGYNIIAHIHQP